MAEDEVKDALSRQWALIADATAHMDLDAPSRIDGWRNAEVLAHLAVQPLLLGRFLAHADTAAPTMRLEDNLAGTHTLAQMIDAAAKRGAQAGQVDFPARAAAVEAALASADMDATVTTLQGRIRLADYLRTRCVEAVVHGMDFRPPVSADPVALSVTVASLMLILHHKAPEVAREIDLSAQDFIDAATGRAPAPVRLAHVMPLMT